TRSALGTSLRTTARGTRRTFWPSIPITPTRWSRSNRAAPSSARNWAATRAKQLRRLRRSNRRNPEAERLAPPKQSRLKRSPRTPGPATQKAARYEAGRPRRRRRPSGAGSERQESEARRARRGVRHAHAFLRRGSAIGAGWSAATRTLHRAHVSGAPE